MRTIVEDLLTFLDKELDTLSTLATDLKFDSGHVLHQHIISLYASIIELSSSITVLYRTSHNSAIPIVVRSVLEAFVDLLNLCKDPRYGYSLTINSNKESLKFLEAAISNEDAYAKMVAKDPDFDTRVTDFRGEIDKLRADGNQEIRIRGKFEKADMLDEYLTTYNMLCAFSHNDIRALRERHVVIENGAFTLELFKQVNLESISIFLGLTSELLLRAATEVHGFFKSSKLEELGAMREHLNGIREAADSLPCAS